MYEYARPSGFVTLFEDIDISRAVSGQTEGIGTKPNFTQRHQKDFTEEKTFQTNSFDT